MMSAGQKKFMREEDRAKGEEMDRNLQAILALSIWLQACPYNIIPTVS